MSSRELILCPKCEGTGQTPVYYTGGGICLEGKDPCSMCNSSGLLLKIEDYPDTIVKKVKVLE